MGGARRVDRRPPTDGGEPRGDLEVRASALHGTTIAAAEVPALIDEVTLIALLACHAEGETVIEGVSELRAKESDRLAAIVEIVTTLGGVAESRGDTLVVAGRPLRGGALSSRGDHRLALLGAVAGLVCPEGVTGERLRGRRCLVPGLCRRSSRR